MKVSEILKLALEFTKAPEGTDEHKLGQAAFDLCNHVIAMNVVVCTKMPQSMIEDGWKSSLHFLELECE